MRGLWPGNQTAGARDNRNAGEGIHTTTIAAAWKNIIYGFSRMRSDGELLVFNPSIPRHWQGYSFQVICRGAVIHVEVNQKKAVIRLIDGSPVQVKVGGQFCLVDRAGYTCE